MPVGASLAPAEDPGAAPDWPALRKAADAASAHAYAPYSGLRVGAAGLCEDGHVVTGCNVENASFGLTLCAECGLVSALVSGGHGRLVAASVTAGDGRPLAPCGRCRQLLMEHGGAELLVDSGSTDPPRRLGELLPGAFDQTELVAHRVQAGSSAGARPGRRRRAGAHQAGVEGPARPGRRRMAGAPPRGGWLKMAPASRAAAPFDAVDLVRAKRDGGELADEEIDWLIRSYVAGNVPDEQVAAFLMAVFFRGMAPRELARFTGAMVGSGDVMDLSGLSRPSVDKHSTGGVGDKVSLVLVPLVASLGAAVPQLSGRGLGHTGGTLDKLEAVPGWRSRLTTEEVLAQLETVGCVICAAGASLVPADRRLYALRDVTGTVESVPLIASSIMSKKIAEGTSALVLDVKVGSGAFMAERRQAGELAKAMVELGRSHNMKVAALLTSMDVPLGRAVGNALEVSEAVDTLEGRGPADLVEITVSLAEVMLELVGLAGDPRRALQDGSALAVWKAMVRSQGGDPDAPLPLAQIVEPVPAERAGFVHRLEARAVGVAAWRLGAGRARKEDPVSAVAGVRCLVKPGDPVEKGQPVLELHTDDAARLERARQALQGAFEVAAEAPAAPASPVLERVG